VLSQFNARVLDFRAANFRSGGEITRDGSLTPAWRLDNHNASKGADGKKNRKLDEFFTPSIQLDYRNPEALNMLCVPSNSAINFECRLNLALRRD
jgi:hypothetical protein